VVSKSTAQAYLTHRLLGSWRLRLRLRYLGLVIIIGLWRDDFSAVKGEILLQF
jgi:hypothetical protein